MKETQHIIELQKQENERVHWQCDCGYVGTCRSEDAEIQAEKHIRADEGAAYRYRAKEAW